MKKEKLDAITTFMKESIWRNPDVMFAMNTDDPGDIDEYFWKLLDVATSLHNELYKEVVGKYYDYAFHWANKIGACEPDDDLFKDIEEGE